MDLRKMTKKTIVDNRDFQLLGSKEELLEAIEKHSKGLRDPYFMIIRNKENDEIGLYSFDKNLNLITDIKNE